MTLVLEYLREWRRTRAEVYVPLVHRPGESAQADFFEGCVELAGERRKAWLFLMRLMHSGRDFVRLYERQDQLAFLDGHVRAFAHFGGVPRRTVYDNLAAAVRRVQFPRRTLTERFAALASHYGVEPCFARPGEGHDKGGVESRGRGVRLQVLTPIPRGDSLHELSEQMQGEVDRLAPQRVWERFASEEPALRPLPEVAFEARRLQPVSVSRSALVRVEGAWYSVPERWAGLSVTAWLGVDDAPGPGSRRARIECNAIALLSGDAESALDPPSPGWLGLHSDREPVRRSGLWNNRHTDEGYDPAFLDVLEELVEETQPP